MHTAHPATDDKVRGGGPSLPPWEALSIALGVPQPVEACLERLLDRLADRS